MERMQEEMDDPTGRRMLSDVIGQCFGKGYEFKITLMEDNGNGGSAADAGPKQSLSCAPQWGWGPGS